MARKSAIPPSYYGEPHKFDPTFTGPVHNRGCTDVLCCVIFVIVILGYIVLGTVAWMHGDPRKVVHATDSYGQFCGQQETPNANKAILFYFNILQCANPTVLINLQCPTTQLCVSKCPDRFATYIDMQYNYRRNKSYWEYYKQFCKPDFNNPDKPVSQVLRDEDCPSMIVPSRPFLQRCFPDFITRNGTLTVANQTSFKDGHGKTRSVIDLREAANKVTAMQQGTERSSFLVSFKTCPSLIYKLTSLITHSAPAASQRICKTEKTHLLSPLIRTEVTDKIPLPFRCLSAERAFKNIMANTKKE